MWNLVGLTWVLALLTSEPLTGAEVARPEPWRRVLSQMEQVRGEIVVNVLVDGLGAGFPQSAFPAPAPPNLQTLMQFNLNLPNFRRLIVDAAAKYVRYDGHTTFPSITYSAWSSWVTGSDPQDHGVTGSDFYRRSDPATDPFWCGTFQNPRCNVDGGMKDPIDLVTFFGPVFEGVGMFDLDVQNVWSAIGTLNSAIRPATAPGDKPTLYEKVTAGENLLSAVVYHFPFRGASHTSLPAAYEGLVEHADSTGWALDAGATSKLKGLMDPDPSDPLALPHLRSPQVLTVYYPGLDTNTHNHGYPDDNLNGPNYLVRLDNLIGTLIRVLDQRNLFDDAIFTITGDHGLSSVGNDDAHSLVLQRLPAFDDELRRVFNRAGYNVLHTWTQTDHDAVLAINGGMTHIYVKHGRTDGPDDMPWSVPPRYMEDVRPIAERFYKNNTGEIIDEPGLAGTLDLILVRNPSSDFSGAYEVLEFITSGPMSGQFEPVPLSEAVGNGWVDARYVNFEENVQRLQDVRSGDVILLPANVCLNNGTGYYFGKTLPAWHGSLCQSDMTIPFIVSFPNAEGEARTRFENIVNTLPLPTNEVRITDIVPTVFQLLTAEDSQ